MIQRRAKLFLKESRPARCHSIDGCGLPRKDGKQRLRRAPAELPAQPNTESFRRIGNKSKMQPSRAALGQPEDKRRYNALQSRIQPPTVFRPFSSPQRGPNDALEVHSARV